MRKIIFLFFLAALVSLVSGCLYQAPLVIHQPPAIGDSYRFSTFPDPTRGWIVNNSRNLYLRFRIDNQALVELAPETSASFNVSLSISHYVYVEGWFWSPAFGWQTVGGVTLGPFTISNYAAFRGSNGWASYHWSWRQEGEDKIWYLWINDSDFDR